MITVQKVLLDKDDNYSLSHAPNSVLINTCKRQELYQGEGQAAREDIRHLFRLVSGLESPLVGESAIQGQVKQCYQRSHSNDLSKGLHQLFQTALSVGKRIRSQTNISKGAMSYEQASVNMLLDMGVKLKNTHITLIGAHRMNENIISFLSKKDAGTILISNRTYQKALDIAKKYDCLAVNFDQLKGVLRQTDILISATTSPHYIVTKKDLCSKRDMIIIDLAVPKDIDPSIEQFENVRLFDIADVEKCVSNNLDKRLSQVEVASKIIDEEVELFISRQGMLYE